MNKNLLLPLSQVESGQQFKIESVHIEGVLRRRLLDLGFVRGAVIEVLQKSPLGDPVAYRVRNTTIALRKEESSLILGTLNKEES